MNNNNIGIIYCPTHRPFSSSKKRWELIAATLAKYDVKYDMIQSEERQSVERLVMMLINNNYKTIVIAGGDAALNDAVNCIMRQERHVRENIVLGVIPNGTMNDFAAFWGLTYKDVEKSVRSIKQCRIRAIDVGCVRYKNKEGEKCRRYFLNCVNIGLLASIQSLRQKTRRILWSRKISFAVSLLLTLFQRMNTRVKYIINSQKETHRILTLCIGSAWGYGQTPNATPYSGTLDVTLVRSTLLSQHIEAIWLFVRGKLLNHKRVLPYRTRGVEIYSDRYMPVSIDGHPLEAQVRGMSIDLEPEEINYIMEELKTK
jgi:diacylglycerol kinase family enzyme